MLNLNNDPSIAYLWQEIWKLFVKKEPGKGLSTEDFTAEEKRKLAGIAEGAQAYAPGDIFVTTRAGNPAGLLGYGTWSQIKDRFLLAAGDSYAAGSTGGEAEHTLTTEEMPSHEHAVRQRKTSPTAVSSFYSNNYTSGSNEYGLTSAAKMVTTGSTDNLFTLAVGSSQPHNNMPPYMAVYMWLRTA